MNRIFILLFFISIHAFSQETLADLHSYEFRNMKLDGYKKCEKIGRKMTYCYNIGTETTYFKNGKIASIKIVGKDSTFIVEEYNNQGEQIVKNGNGYNYEIENGSIDFPHRDSLVYEITNNKRTGKFQRYRRYLNTSYYLMQSGNLNDNLEVGTWNSNETRLGIVQIKNYKDGELNGYYFMRQNSKNTIEYGNMVNGRQNGLWIICDTNNRKIEECFYLDGYKFGQYILYYMNGSISEKGNYIQIKGIRVYNVEDFDGNIKVEKRKVRNIEVKDGIWEFYSEDGKLIRTEKYKKGRLE